MVLEGKFIKMKKYCIRFLIKLNNFLYKIQKSKFELLNKEFNLGIEKQILKFKKIKNRRDEHYVVFKKNGLMILEESENSENCHFYEKNLFIDFDGPSWNRIYKLAYVDDAFEEKLKFIRLDDMFAGMHYHGVVKSSYILSNHNSYQQEFYWKRKELL